MKAVAKTKGGTTPVEPEEGDSFDECLRKASEIATDVENVHFIVVKK